MNISIHLNKAHFLAQKFPFTFIWKASFFLEWHKGIYRAIRISIAHLNADEGYLKYLNHLNLIHNIYIWHFSFAPDKVCGGLFQIFFFFFVNFCQYFEPIYFLAGNLHRISVDCAFHTVGIQFVLSDVQFASMFRFFFCVCTNSLEIWK